MDVLKPQIMQGYMPIHIGREDLTDIHQLWQKCSVGCRSYFRIRHLSSGLYLTATSGRLTLKGNNLLYDYQRTQGDKVYIFPTSI